MKICFSGVHGTGKTTLLNELKKNEKLKDYIFVEEITRSLIKDGFIINEKGDEKSQFMLSMKHWEVFNKYDNLIIDRGIFDVLCYTKYLFMHQRCSYQCLEFIKYLTKQMKYDYIFYIKPEFNLVDDGVRSINVEFRNEVFKYFENYLMKLNLPNVIYLTGSIENRLKIIYNILNLK